jgi:hypothetical protein
VERDEVEHMNDRRKVIRREKAKEQMEVKRNETGGWRGQGKARSPACVLPPSLNTGSS